ncbi:hypothetical protein GGH96_002439 [Coemansia sp. RSA 1972]|nr:hypothetical protein GGH96_002439 [Coemansia sp. RSA 1972]
MSDQAQDTAQDIFLPPTTAETVVFYISLAINLANFFPIIYALVYRKFPPMRAQHVGITVSIGIGGIIFNISYNLVEGMAKYEGVLGVCKFWGAWVMFTLGLGIVMAAINMRLVLFYRIFVTGNTYARSSSRIKNFIRRFWPFFALWLPTIITSIVISALPGRQGAWLLEDHGLRACNFSYGYTYWIYAYFAAQIVLSWVLYFRMRKIAQAFNGFRVAIWTLLIFTTILLSSMIINIIKGANKSWGRITIALVNVVMMTAYIWLILGPPVIGHIFRREQTMRKFMNSLHKDALIAQQTRAVDMQSQLYCASDSDVYDINPMNDHDEPYNENNHPAAMKEANASEYDFKSPHITFSPNSRYML